MIALFAAAALSLQPAAPGIDFSGVQADLGGEPNRVLVLGTPHLRQLEEGVYQPSHMELVLDRLEAFAPDVIAIEATNGRGCDAIFRFPALYPGVADSYCWDPAPAQEALDISLPEAVMAMRARLADFPADPTAAQRREYALLFFAAGEPWSAGLQWAYLDEAERIPADSVTEELVALFDRYVASLNENNQIGVQLAMRLGLQSLAATDDRSADIILRQAPDTVWQRMNTLWQMDIPGTDELRAEAASHLGSAEGMLAHYRLINGPEYQQNTIDNDFGLAASQPGEGAVARQYLAWWQARGLRMAANVVEAAGHDPGARVLVLVGSSHKAYYDAYLDQMHDWELISVDAILHD